MYLKKGVDLRGITPELVLGLMVADRLHQEMTGEELVVTSVCDGKHGPRSLHYKGRAADLRRWILDGVIGYENRAQKFCEELAKRLGEQWDVVLEGDHIHFEFDPKR